MVLLAVNAEAALLEKVELVPSITVVILVAVMLKPMSLPSIVKGIADTGFNDNRKV